MQVLCPNGDHVNGGPSLIAIGLTSSVRGSPMNELLDSTLGGRHPKQRKRAKQPLLCGSSSWQLAPSPTFRLPCSANPSRVQHFGISVAKRAAVPALHVPILRCRIKAFGVVH